MRVCVVLIATLFSTLAVVSSGTNGGTAAAATGHWRAQTIHKARQWILEGGGMFHKVDIVVATAGNVGDAGQPAAAEDDAAGTCSERSGESNVCVADSARSEWAQSVAGEDLGGVFASDDIEEGEVLFRIPHSHIFSGERASSDPMVQRLKKAAKINDDAPPEFFTVRNMLVVALMQLRFEVELHSSAKLEEEPFFGPFISTLPQTFNHLPQNFQPYQHHLLHGSHFVAEVLEDNLRDRAKHNLYCQLDQVYKDRYDFADYQWAYSVVQSRAFGMKLKRDSQSKTYKTPTLVPVLDMLNHRRKPNTMWSYNDKIHAATLTATKHIAKGQEVTTPYGSRDSAHYFDSYGFVPSGYPVIEKNAAVPSRPEEGLMKYIVGLPLDPETFIETLHWGCLNISATTLAMYPTGTRSDTSFFRWLATGALSNTTSSLSSASVLCLSTLPPREEARTIVLHAAAQSLGLPSAALCSSAAKLADELRRSSGTALSLLSACWTRSLSDLVLDMQIQEQARARFFASVTDSAPSEVASAWANYTQLMMDLRLRTINTFATYLDTLRAVSFAYPRVANPHMLVVKEVSLALGLPAQAFGEIVKRLKWAAPFQAELNLATQKLKSSAAVDLAVAEEFARTGGGSAADIASMAVANITLPPGLRVNMAPRQPPPVLSYTNGSCGDFYSSSILAAERVRWLPLRATFIQPAADSVAATPTSNGTYSFSCDPRPDESLDPDMAAQPLTLIKLQAHEVLAAVAIDCRDASRLSHLPSAAHAEPLKLFGSQFELYVAHTVAALARRQLAKFPESIEADTAVLQLLASHRGVSPLEARGIPPARACIQASDTSTELSTVQALCDSNLTSVAKMSYSDECSIRYRHGEKSVLRLLLLGAAGAVDVLLEQHLPLEPRSLRKRSQTLRELMGVAIRRMGRVVQAENLFFSQSSGHEPQFLEVKSLKCPAADARSQLSPKPNNDRPTEPLLELSNGKRRQYVSAWLLHGETILDERMQLIPWATRFGPLHGRHGSSRNLRILDRIAALARQSWAKLDGGKPALIRQNFQKLLALVLDRVRHFSQDTDHTVTLEPTPVLLKNPSFVVNVLPAMGHHAVNPLSDLFLQSLDLVDSEQATYLEVPGDELLIVVMAVVDNYVASYARDGNGLPGDSVGQLPQAAAFLRQLPADLLDYFGVHSTMSALSRKTPGALRQLRLHSADFASIEAQHCAPQSLLSNFPCEAVRRLTSVLDEAIATVWVSDKSFVSHYQKQTGIPTLHFENFTSFFQQIVSYDDDEHDERSETGR